MSFLAGRNQSNSGETARGQKRGFDVRGDGHVREEAEPRGAGYKFTGNIFDGAKQGSETGNVGEDRIRRGVFDARGHRPSQIEQSGVRGAFLRRGTMANFHVAELRGLRFGHAHLNPGAQSGFVRGHDFPERRSAVDQRNGAIAERRLAANQRLNQESGNMNGSKSHKNSNSTAALVKNS